MRLSKNNTKWKKKANEEVRKDKQSKSNQQAIGKGFAKVKIKEQQKKGHQDFNQEVNYNTVYNSRRPVTKKGKTGCNKKDISQSKRQQTGCGRKASVKTRCRARSKQDNRQGLT